VGEVSPVTGFVDKLEGKLNELEVKLNEMIVLVNQTREFTRVVDSTPPTISGFEVTSSYPNRIYFNSSETITGSTVTGISLSGVAETVSSVTINGSNTTGHYFTLSSTIEFGNSFTISGTGADNIQDVAGNGLAAFGPTSVTNSIPDTPSPPTMEKVVAGSGYTYGFWKYLPEGFETYPTKKWPVLIFMHGTGARGTGNSADLDKIITIDAPTVASEIGHNAGAPKVGSPWLSGGSNTYKDMIVLMPQTATTMDRGPLGTFIRDVLADTDMRIDPDRVFLTGLSLGFISGARYLINTEADYNRVAGDRPPIAGAYLIAGKDWQTAYATLTVNRGIEVMSWCGELDPDYRTTSERVITDINAIRASYVPAFIEIAGAVHNNAAWGPQYQDYTSGSMYARLLDKPLRIIPSKSTGGNWPVSGFTSAVTLPVGVDLLTDDIKVMLVTSSHTPAGDTFISTVDDNELSGTGYTAGGVSLSSKSLVGNDFDAADVIWSNSEFTNVRYIYLYKNTGTPATSPIIGYINLGHNRNTDGVDFVIQWYSTGILTKV